MTLETIQSYKKKERRKENDSDIGTCIKTTEPYSVSIDLEIIRWARYEYA